VKSSDGVRQLVGAQVGGVEPAPPVPADTVVLLALQGGRGGSLSGVDGGHRHVQAGLLDGELQVVVVGNDGRRVPREEWRDYVGKPVPETTSR
jgi:hypothetical protein